MKIIVLFGKIGSGKTYIGKLLEKYFHFYFYEGDLDLTPEMKNSLKKNQPVTDSMRNKFFDILIINLNMIIKNHKNIVVSQTFIKEKYRKMFLRKFPKSEFVYIKSDDKKRREKVARRSDYNFKKSYVLKMDKNFEEPKIPVKIITNDFNGRSDIKHQLEKVLAY